MGLATRQPAGKRTEIVHHSASRGVLMIKFGPEDRIAAMLAVEKWHILELIDDEEREFFRHLVITETWEPDDG